MSSQYWSVAVDAPLDTPLTYLAGENSSQLVAGARVDVPLGRRKAAGVLLSQVPQPEETKYQIKSIIGLDDTHPAIPALYLQWGQWLASYYMHPIGNVMSSFFPPLKKKLKERKSKRAPVLPSLALVEPHPLLPQQIEAVEGVLKSPGFSTHLLYGVTGSGKTEVYLECLENVLKTGKQGLVLVPEISLTPQLIHRFSKRFGDKIAVIHSHLTEREKTDQWWSMVDGQKQILIGARSALFCPLERLGLIIVDEEHEPSFKQDEKLKYHGRDAAIMLAKLTNCPIILGSATPSLETWQNALAGRYQLHQLKQRVKERPLPEVRLIDLRDTPKCPDTHWLSVAMKLEIDRTLERGKQVALFLNRRGTAPVVICQSCGKVCECPNCDISLTLHRSTDLVCHYCSYHENYTTLCKQCGERKVLPSGLGTEQVETDLKRMYPGAHVARADRDEIQDRADLEELLSDMESGKIQILVGTQMIAKGLDFPLLETVGFVFADVGFALPDFRSTERSFQLVTQMSGRAGRHATNPDERGRVLIQTLNPLHPALQFVSDEAFPQFAEAELQSREELGFPPYGRLALLRISATSLRDCSDGAEVIRTRLKALRERNSYQGIEILGPAPAPIEKLRGRFRYQALIKGPDSRLLHQYLSQFMKPLDWLPKKLKLSLDIDPLNLL